MRLANKTLLITGGGSGIGKATAMLFARRGATVHILDIGEAACAQVAREIREQGGQASAHACDVTRQAAVHTSFESIGPIDILINNAGVTQPVDSATLAAAIPANLRDPAGNWFALSLRARLIYAAKDQPKLTDFHYEDLADPKWKGKICTRDGQHSYNIGLFASMIAHNGEAETEKWLTGLKNNLAKKPDGGDRDQAKAILAGECDLALGNTYYVGLMLTNEKEPEQKEWAAAIKVLFPNAKDRGTH
eukprot:gene46128-56470_t